MYGCWVCVSPCKHFVCVCVYNIVVESHRLWNKFEFCGQVGSQYGQTNGHESHGFLIFSAYCPVTGYKMRESIFISLFRCHIVKTSLDRKTSLYFLAFMIFTTSNVNVFWHFEWNAKFLRCANKRGLFGLHTFFSREMVSELFVCSQSHFRCEFYLFFSRHF